MTKYALGRRVNHDPLSRNFPAPQATHHRPVRHRTYGPILNQGNLGSCVGNASAAALNTAGTHRVPSRLMREDDAVKIYSAATKLDPFEGEYPPTDEGTDANSAAKAMRDLGLVVSWEHAFGLEHTLLALQLKAVMLGISWHRSMFDPTEEGFVYPTGDVEGGHEVLLVGDDPDGRFVTARNSWGPEWGLKGYFKLRYQDLEVLLADSGDVVVLTV